MPRTGQGRITSGIAPRTLVHKTIAFVLEQLGPWRDDPSRASVDSEEALSSQLCKFLNVASRAHFSMVHFHHEEHQRGRHRVDLSASPARRIRIGLRSYTIYEPFLVLEAKRLPAPSPDREREYLTGWEKRTGGVQRFKLGLHGAELDTAAMVGYLQQGTAAEWHRKLNEWIAELIECPDTEHDCWGPGEHLQELSTDAGRATARCQSAHARVPAESGGTIVLYHLWVELAGFQRARE